MTVGANGGPMEPKVDVAGGVEAFVNTALLKAIDGLGLNLETLTFDDMERVVALAAHRDIPVVKYQYAFVELIHPGINQIKLKIEQLLSEFESNGDNLGLVEALSSLGFKVDNPAQLEIILDLLEGFDDIRNGNVREIQRASDLVVGNNLEA